MTIPRQPRFVEIVAGRIDAYSPVTARLANQLRDNVGAVATQHLRPCGLIDQLASVTYTGNFVPSTRTCFSWNLYIPDHCIGLKTPTTRVGMWVYVVLGMLTTSTFRRAGFRLKQGSTEGTYIDLVSKYANSDGVLTGNEYPNSDPLIENVLTEIDISPSPGVVSFDLEFTYEHAGGGTNLGVNQAFWPAPPLNSTFVGIGGTITYDIPDRTYGYIHRLD